MQQNDYRQRTGTKLSFKGVEQNTEVTTGKEFCINIIYTLYFVFQYCQKYLHKNLYIHCTLVLDKFSQNNCYFK